MLQSADSSVDGVTNSNGVYVTRGKSDCEYNIYVKKDGYYPSKLECQSVMDPRHPNDPKVVDQEVTLVLRKMRMIRLVVCRVVFIVFSCLAGKSLHQQWINLRGTNHWQETLILSIQGKYRVPTPKYKGNGSYGKILL